MKDQTNGSTPQNVLKRHDLNQTTNVVAVKGKKKSSPNSLEVEEVNNPEEVLGDNYDKTSLIVKDSIRKQSCNESLIIRGIDNNKLFQPVLT